MKKLLMFGCMLAAIAGFTACEEAGNGGYDGVNYIYLTAQDGKTTLYETDEEPLVVEVMLTTALEEDLTLTFALTGTDGVVALEGNPVTIAAGEKTATFSVVSNNANVLEEAANYTVALDASTVLPENVELKGALAFVVSPMTFEALTEAQKAIIEAYKTSTGVDLGKYVGVVNVTVEYTGFDNENEIPLDPVTFTGKTVITLSESATAELPVFKMTSNPMGIQDKMYEVLRSVTVDYEDWCNEYASESYATLMTAIGWNADSEEIFTMSLDGITFNADKSVDFLGTYVDEYDEECVRVPFDYTFTAYEREKAAIAEGLISPETDDEWAWDATANPYMHLNNSDISEDWFGYGNWIESTASVSNEALTFTFCVYGCWLDYDFTRVVATYTPNN